MTSQWMITAHGAELQLLVSLFGTLAVILACIVYAVLAIPCGVLVGLLAFRNRRKRVRLAAGIGAAVFAFVGLWVIEIVLLKTIDLPQT